MRNARFEKIYESGFLDFEQFRQLSDYIVERYVQESLDAPLLTAFDRETISKCSAIDMAMGSNFKKIDHILIGILIGIFAAFMLIEVKTKIRITIKIKK